MSDPLKCMLIPTVGRSRAEFAAPFADSGRFEDLTIERREMFFGEGHIWADFERSGDAEAFDAERARFPPAPSSRSWPPRLMARTPLGKRNSSTGWKPASRRGSSRRRARWRWC